MIVIAGCKFEVVLHSFLLHVITLLVVREGSGQNSTETSKNKEKSIGPSPRGANSQIDYWPPPLGGHLAVPYNGIPCLLTVTQLLALAIIKN
jgi:hypothetical protein